MGQSLGFMLALLSISIVREILGFGTIFQGWAGADGEGIRLLPTTFPNWNVMVLAPGAFFTLGILLGLANWISTVRAKKQVA